MSLFDCYMAVDWSAANAPKTGRDSIWVAASWPEGGARHAVCKNIATRDEAMAWIQGFLEASLGRGYRTLAGFDFAFGYPRGFAKLLPGFGCWEDVWRIWTDRIRDDARNRSNRFDVADELNAGFGRPIFWGKPHQARARYTHLPTKKPRSTDLPERRHTEEKVRGAKSVFQLAYNGAVGSQTLLGVPRLLKLRERLGKDRVRVWPFETRFDQRLPEGPCVVLAEIYPSLLVRSRPQTGTKDEAQVQAAIRAFADWDRRDRMLELLGEPEGTTREERKDMIVEEGAILGAGLL